MGIASLRRYHNLPPSPEKSSEKPVVAVPDREHTRTKDTNGFRADKLAEKLIAAKK